MVEHLLKYEVQKRPVVVVHAAPPQIQAPALTVLPFVSVQKGPVAQMQRFLEEHFSRASVSTLNRVL